MCDWASMRRRHHSYRAACQRPYLPVHTQNHAICTCRHNDRHSLHTPYIMQSVHAGTTTATVLTRAIFSEGCKSVAAGMNPMDLRRGITLAVDKVLDYLKKHAKMISTTEEIAQVSAQPRPCCPSTYANAISQ